MPILSTARYRINYLQLIPNDSLSFTHSFFTGNVRPNLLKIVTRSSPHDCWLRVELVFIGGESILVQIHDEQLFRLPEGLVPARQNRALEYCDSKQGWIYVCILGCFILNPIPGQCGQIQKIGWESKPNIEKSFILRNWNYIATVLWLSNHWPSNKSISFKSIYEKLASPSFLSECSQDLLVQNKNEFR